MNYINDNDYDTMKLKKENVYVDKKILLREKIKIIHVSISLTVL